MCLAFWAPTAVPQLICEDKGPMPPTNSDLNEVACLTLKRTRHGFRNHKGSSYYLSVLYKTSVSILYFNTFKLYSVLPVRTDGETGKFEIFLRQGISWLVHVTPAYLDG